MAVASEERDSSRSGPPISKESIFIEAKSVFRKSSCGTLVLKFCVWGIKSTDNVAGVKTAAKGTSLETIS
jgi:hypothetical protein